MPNRSLTSNLGLYAYAAGAVALGLIGLAWGDLPPIGNESARGFPGARRSPISLGFASLPEDLG